MHCPHCRAEIPSGASMCPNCGAAAPTRRLSPDDIDAEPRCAVCGGALDDGYVSDRDAARRVRWSRFSQNATKRTWDIPDQRPTFYLVTAYRCVDCGRLELYAHSSDISRGT